MSLGERLEPVALVTGAGTRLGAMMARGLERHARGGLILVDGDDAALQAAADALENPPDRVSTLAFNDSDRARWEQAREFIAGAYGRLDWAAVYAFLEGGAGGGATTWKRAVTAPLDAAFVALRAAITLMRDNTQGGAAVLIASADALLDGPGGRLAEREGLLQFMRVAAREAGASRVRVNAIAIGDPAAPAWAHTPAFDIAQDTLNGAPPALARYEGRGDIARLARALMSDMSSITGATLVADGGHTL